MAASDDQVVERLLRARLGPEAVAPPSEDIADLDVARAYAIQRRLEEALARRGIRSVGWKVGFTGRAAQEQYGVAEPVLGFLPETGVFAGGDAVPAARFVGLSVELELAFVLKADLAGPGVSAPRALCAVEGAVPSFELIDRRLTGKPRGVDIIADGVYTSGIVLGRPVTPVAGLDLGLEGVVFEQNGQVVGTHTCAEVMGNPLASLAWLANALGRMGRSLRAGDIVLTGSISRILPAQKGDALRGSFTRLGSVACRFV